MTTMTFHGDEIPKDVQHQVPAGAELRCPHWHPKKKAVCNKLLAKGEAPLKPLEFKCPNCGNLTTFVKA